MVSNVKAGETSAEDQSSKKNKKKGNQYECEVTCLDGAKVNVSVEVWISIFNFSAIFY